MAVMDEVSVQTMACVIAAALIIVMVWPSPAAAQGFQCVPIRQGDTAAAIARRITGDVRSRHEPWFQIVNPATSAVIPKARYDHVRPGWRACVATAASVDNINSNIIVWVALVVAIVLASSNVGESVTARQQMVDAMRRFGEAFAREFERPLLLPNDSRPAVRVRLRTNAYRRQLEVLLAPAAGRRYPNLADHKKNVEYDVGRVLQQLQDPTIAGGVLYAQGQWVVVPFQFRNSSQQAGGK